MIGRLVAVVPPARNQWNRGPEAEKMRRSFNEEGYKADIATLRQIHPGLQTFEQHPRRNGWKNAPPVPPG